MVYQYQIQALKDPRLAQRWSKILVGLAMSINWDEVMKTAAIAYAETFTEEKLKQLVAFHKSPVGQKLQEKQPELTFQTTRLIEKMIVSLMNPNGKLECDRSCAATVGKTYNALERLVLCFVTTVSYSGIVLRHDSFAH